MRIRQSLAPALYRFRTTFRQGLGGYLAIVVLLGLVGGVALGAIAGARSTQSSYPVYLASTRPADFQVFTGFLNPALGPQESRGYRASTERQIAALPYVKSEQTVVGFDANIDQLIGVHVRVEPGAKPPSLEGPVASEYFNQDRVTVVSGHLPDLANPGQAVMNAQAGKELGLRVGSTMTVTLNSDGQLLSSANNPPAVARARLQIVGLVVFPQDVLNDDYGTAGTAEILVTPSLTRRIENCCATYSYSSLRAVPGHDAAVESELSSVLPRKLLTAVGVRPGARAIAPAERSIEPESVALGVFGGLAALAALVIVAQIIGRQRRIESPQLATLRALGADPTMNLVDATLGTVAAVVTGAVLATVIAFLLSPLFPFGPVRGVYPYFFAWDWTVIGFGFLVLVVILTTAAIGLAWRMSPERVRRRRQEDGSVVARLVGSSALPAPAMIGVRFALEPGRSSEAVPVRSAILGATLAILVIVSTVTFGSSLRSLIDHPALYGWNWNYALFSAFSGDEDLPAHITGNALARDPSVTQYSGANFASASIDAHNGIPVIGMRPGAPVQPPVLQGTDLRTARDIVLGASTMAALHTHIGATVDVGIGRGRGQTTRLVVAGEATFPAIMGPGMGTGALVDVGLIPPAVRNAQGNSIPGPQVFFVRTKGGVSSSATRSLAEVTREINKADAEQPASGPTTALRPEVIVNSGSIETLPTILGAGLAVGAGIALAVTLVASVRRRRRDLAVLKTLGLSARQLASVVTWQATVAVLIGIVLGVPLGIVSGRLLWNLFAQNIDAVPSPAVPALVVTAIALGALVLANLVALIPGRIAARTPTAVLLRAD